LFLIYSENIAVLKEITLLGTTIRSTKESTRNSVSALRTEKVTALKRGLESQQNVFRKQSSESISGLREIYRVAHLLAKESKPLSGRESICKITVKDICPGKKKLLLIL